jgi:anaerobic dimethyl sulfoxide reductase subunit B (iron-sulfur subunit)
MTYAFSFDASACSGCKACQAACKDKNNLPGGVLWRRVIEVSGGEWVQNGGAWSNTVFAYNLTIACNHCVHPKCAGVCPTSAYHVREDGIVLLDSSKCAGCGYCSWACPYAVPQYNPASGLMSKCNFCYDDIEAGRSPACVAACPLRVLDFMEVTDQKNERPGVSLWEVPGSEHPFPLPLYSRTQPHIHLNPHPAMLNTLDKTVANREEIKPQKSKSELPLVAFSLLIQMSVGALWISQWLFNPFWALISSNIFPLRRFPSLLIGLCLAMGLGIAFAHIGAKHNAWRMLSNLHKSWLSKEILFLGLFGAGWLLTLFIPSVLSGLLTSILGFGLIYSMANIYQLRSMAVWNSWRTLASFLISALLLGQMLLIPVLLIQSSLKGIVLPREYLIVVNWFSGVLLVGELALMFSYSEKMKGFWAGLRMGLILAIIIGLASILHVPEYSLLGIYSLFLLLLIAEQILGRWWFYNQLDRRIL